MFKRIIIISFSLIFFSFIIFYFSNKSNMKIIEVMNVPITSRIIVVDAGHGTPDEGAENSDGITEAKINLSIAYKLKNLLESSGAQVIMTRSGDNGIYDEDSKTISQKKVSDIKNRVKIGNSSSADIFVSIHLNKIPQEKYWGWQTFFKEGDSASKNLAIDIQNNLNASISNDNKRVPLKLGNIYIMKHIEIPICLIECGFLSNKEEAKKLITDEYQQKLAWGIYDGITEYFAK